MSTFHLTIDDGLSSTTFGKLKLFEAHRIQAVWFCLGMQLKRYPHAAMELIKAGHIIGNHSYDHPSFSNINFEECKGQIVRTEQIIDDLYDRTGVIRPAKLFRFPYGDQGHFENWRISMRSEKVLHRQKLQQLLRELEFFPPPVSKINYLERLYTNRAEDIDWLWSYDVQEWAIGNTGYCRLLPEDVIHNLRLYLRKHDRTKSQVVLMHDQLNSSSYFLQLMRLFLQAGTHFTLPDFH